MKPELTVESLFNEAKDFAEAESSYSESSLFGVTDGKAVGTYLEHKFKEQLRAKYDMAEGSSASGIDLPSIEVDIKVTSNKQPQSSCPYKNARQKIYGLGYSLLVFVYDKTDDDEAKTATLNILHVIFIEKERTADFQTTTGIRKILENEGNEDDLLAFLQERMLPVDDIEAANIVKEITDDPPILGYLTISNALQWRLHYRRVIEKAGSVDGVKKII
jgi:hypothetical protein